jgi:hypothetical protein
VRLAEAETRLAAQANWVEGPAADELKECMPSSMHMPAYIPQRTYRRCIPTPVWGSCEHHSQAREIAEKGRLRLWSLPIFTSSPVSPLPPEYTRATTA